MTKSRRKSCKTCKSVAKTLSLTEFPSAPVVNGIMHPKTHQEGDQVVETRTPGFRSSLKNRRPPSGFPQEASSQQDVERTEPSSGFRTALREPNSFAQERAEGVAADEGTAGKKSADDSGDNVDKLTGKAEPKSKGEKPTSKSKSCTTGKRDEDGCSEGKEQKSVAVSIAKGTGEATRAEKEDEKKNKYKKDLEYCLRAKFMTREKYKKKENPVDFNTIPIQLDELYDCHENGMEMQYVTNIWGDGLVDTLRNAEKIKKTYFPENEKDGFQFIADMIHFFLLEPRTKKIELRTKKIEPLKYDHSKVEDKTESGTRKVYNKNGLGYTFDAEYEYQIEKLIQWFVDEYHGDIDKIRAM